MWAFTFRNTHIVNESLSKDYQSTNTYTFLELEVGMMMTTVKVL